MELEQRLLAYERELAGGDGDTYRARLTDDAILIVPGQALDKQTAVAVMDASAGWDAVEMQSPEVRRLAGGAALLTYRFTGRRGPSRYTALMGSVYVERDGDWRMAFHQQTPLE
jgi:hypothetical protein